jgi:hypothetical protein
LRRVWAGKNRDFSDGRRTAHVDYLFLLPGHDEIDEEEVLLQFCEGGKDLQVGVGVVRLLNAELNSFPAVSRKYVVRKSFGELNATRAREREHGPVNTKRGQLKKSIKRPTIARCGDLYPGLVVLFIRDRFQ